MRIAERYGIEEGKVFYLFTRSHEAYWHTKFMLNIEDCATFAATIQLGQDDPGDASALLECLCLRDCVLSGGSV